MLHARTLYPRKEERMIVLDLAYWNVRWRPWKDLAVLQANIGRPRPLRAGDDVPLGVVPSEFFSSRGEWLD